MATQVEDIKWLPNGYPVMIDGFRFADKARCSHYVLTHAHSDHTTGLRRRRFEHGRIFCTTVTAAAIEHDLALPSITLDEYLSGGSGPPPPFDPARPVVACPLNARFPLCEGVFATFGDANHCPGAAVVVFEVPDRPCRRVAAAKGAAAGGGCLEEKSVSAAAAAAGGGGGGGPAATPSSTSSSSIVVVHTGDMRFDAGKMAAPGTPLGQLLARGKRVHTLVLDTTYCAPRWRLPPQRDTIAALGRALRVVASGSTGGGGGGGQSSQQQSHRVLVAFSAYHLGKERCYFGAARALGWRVYLPPAKRRFLEVLGELSPENGYAWRLDLVAEHPWEAEIHVVGRGALNVPRQQQQQQTAAARGAAGGGAGGDGGGDDGTNGNNANARPRGGRYRSQQQQMPLAEWLQAYLDQTNAALARHQQTQRHHNHLRPFSRAAAVRASGWCFRPQGQGFNLYRPTQTTALVSVPYSEHSSFDDLISCVGLLRPQHVIPTVGAETKQQRDALVDSLAPHGIDLRQDRSRLDAYFAEGGVAAGGVARAAALHERRLRRRERGRGGSAGGSGEGDQEEEEEEEEEEDEDLWEGERWSGAAEGGADEPGAEVDLSRVDVEGQRRALEALERERERDRREQLRRQQLAGSGNKGGGGNGGGKRPPAAGAGASAPAKRGGGGGIRAFFAPKQG
jgi:DNA cross-link repair 1A protein